MKEKLKKLLDGFNATNSGVVKRAIYDAMLNQVNAYCKNVRYGCYDMYMYTALYKCAITSQERIDVLERICSIIDDDSYQYHDALIENFKEFICMSPFLRKENKIEFDILCMMEIDFFKKSLKWSEDQAKCGHADFIPDIPVNTARKELKDVAALVLASNMPDLESYKEAYKIIKQ